MYFNESPPEGNRLDSNALKSLASATLKRSPRLTSGLELAIDMGYRNEFDKRIGFSCFLLGTHDRVGSDSVIRLLPNDILYLIGIHLFTCVLESIADIAE